MGNIEQKVVWYRNYESIPEIREHMESCIANGWRVHTCLEKGYDVLVVYEREKTTDEEQSFIEGTEFALDWGLPIPNEDFEEYVELTNNN